jgi:hypothetical protein
VAEVFLDMATCDDDGGRRLCRPRHRVH